MTNNYGGFLDSVVSFVIVACAVYLLVRGMNRLKRQEEAAPPPPSKKECPHCVTGIPIKATCCPNCPSELRAA